MLFSALRSGMSLMQITAYIISSVIVIFLTLPIHEFAHGFVATKLGDPTPRYQGRLTLNPLAHIDYIGALCILVFGFGWAKPVRVDMRRFKSPKRDMAITALAGPVSNILVAFVSIVIMTALSVFFYRYSITYYAITVFYMIANINVYLAVFNLIPIPPLDGSRILSAFLPSRIYYKIMQYERYIIIAVFALIYIGVLSVPLNYLSSLILNGLSNVAGLMFGVL